MKPSKELREAVLSEYAVPTPYEMHQKHGMGLPARMLRRGMTAAEARGPRLILTRKEGRWHIESKLSGESHRVWGFDRQKDARRTAYKLLGQLRSGGIDFVFSDGLRTWRVMAGDTVSFQEAQAAMRIALGLRRQE
jgi:hypothetical protein